MIASEPAEQTILTRLADTPVLGVSMANVSVLRLDRLGGAAPGNKLFKLQGWAGEAQRLGCSGLLSFGGVWSNHLHALAASGSELGLATVGILRGGEADTPMLRDARRWGMRLVPVSREEYRRRHDPEYQAQLSRRFAPCLVIPEGGGGAPGVRGCLTIASMIRATGPDAARVLLAVGTGTTLAGVAAGLSDGGTEVIGVSALKGASDLEARVAQALEVYPGQAVTPWSIVHDAHCGGFARVSPGLREFMLAFEAVHRVPLDPVYTAKMMYAIYRRLQSGEWDADEPLLAIHSGGLQGRRGFPFLNCQPG